eukprot:TRINITY_DN13737_c0_g1_i1.p1 TRINITY_DN13737_c0_g1~~TRINITY_DN13737_c0_g1_i1.p1  ORF type:complete len:386 (-),score=31.51 TRINITY_DN13737_c0_g1_i1:245-1234(-)
MADNSLGPGVIHSDDACKTTDFIGPAGGMNLDIAFTPGGVTGCMATVSGLLLTQDGTTFKKVSEITGVSQNVEAFGSSSLGATGGFMNKSTKKQVNGVAVSTNYGTTWDIYDIGLESKYIARYGAFPSATTWYVSSGSWPSSTEKLEAAHKLSSRVNMLFNNQNQTAEFVSSKASNGAAAVTGYPGAISKTTDGGKTWTKVFDSDGSMYFNQIHCNDEQACMAVAENDEGAYGLATTDGGVTWNTVLTAPAGGSLMGCRMISSTEAWMSGGGMEDGKGLVGYFYHTLDNGATWELSELGQAYSMDLSFSNGVGYSAALNQAYSSIAVYN